MKSLILAALILLSLVGCFEQPGEGKTPPQDVVEFVKSQVARLKDARYEEFRENADFKTLSRESDKVLAAATDLIPKEPPQSVTVLAEVAPQN